MEHLLVLDSGNQKQSLLHYQEYIKSIKALLGAFQNTK